MAEQERGDGTVEGQPDTDTRSDTTYVVLELVNDSLSQESMYREVARVVSNGRKPAVAQVVGDDPAQGRTFKAVPLSSWKSVWKSVQRKPPRQVAAGFEGDRRMSAAHVYHDGLPDFDERNIYHDGCPVCEERAASGLGVFHWLDDDNLQVMIDRAHAVGGGAYGEDSESGAYPPFMSHCDRRVIDTIIRVIELAPRLLRSARR